MKSLKKEIIDSIIYLNENKGSYNSISDVAKLFKIDKATIKKYKDINLNKLVFFENKYYMFSEEELEAIDEYTSSDVTMLYIKEKYGYKQETFIKKLKILGYPTTRKYKVPLNRNVFNEISTEEDAYFLGLLLADGYIHENKGMVRLKLQSCDIDILKKFCNYLETTHDSIKYENHTLTGNLQCYVGIHSKEIIARLTKYGITQRKSCKEVPYYNIDETLLKHYIRGIFDGDGSIKTNLKGINICGSLEILKFICDAFDKHLDIKTTEKQYLMQGKIYKRYFTGDNMMKILDYLYSDASVFLDRKYTLYTAMKLHRIAMSKLGNIGKS